jgi:large subunit ribosomal protein L11
LVERRFPKSNIKGSNPLRHVYLLFLKIYYMSKKIKAFVKLALVGGKATSAPPVGPALGQHGINIIAFCKEYNLKTNDNIGLIIPVKITIYEDKSYSFILKSSPASFLILHLLNLKKGSSKPNIDSIGKISKDQLISIAKQKLNDLNTKDLNKAILIIAGTAKNMGLTIEN